MNRQINWLRRSAWLGQGSWRHGWTTGAGPDFKTDPEAPRHAMAVSRLVAAVGLPGAAWARQVHGDTILRAIAPGFAGSADALWTDRPGLGVIGRSADCPLILVAGRRQDGAPVWGFAHASWRSTLKGIGPSLVAAMAGEGALPPTMTAVICPSAGPCCYEVGLEVQAEARAALGPGADSCFRNSAGRLIFDLWIANSRQLAAAGVPRTSIHRAGICTICNPEYPSFRREGQGAGRFAAVIGWR